MGSKDVLGNELMRKKSLLQQEGIMFENSSTVTNDVCKLKVSISCITTQLFLCI